MTKRPRSRTGRVLLWILLIVLALIVLSVLFGGFQKGTKESGLGAPHPMASIAWSAGRPPYFRSPSAP